MKQQTIIEWYIEAIEKLPDFFGWETKNDIINQAKKMERNRIEEAFQDGKCEAILKKDKNYADMEHAAIYYSKKYNK